MAWNCYDQEYLTAGRNHMSKTKKKKGQIETSEHKHSSHNPKKLVTASETKGLLIVPRSSNVSIRKRCKERRQGTQTRGGTQGKTVKSLHNFQKSGIPAEENRHVR